MERLGWIGAFLVLAWMSGSCAMRAPTLTGTLPTEIATGFNRREISFQSRDGTRLVGQFDDALEAPLAPLVFIIHHSGPVDRSAYQYLAERLTPAGYSVFRFDKRGNGASGGVYGCCEDDDALAAYRAAIRAGGFDSTRVFIVAQSIGTRILAQRYAEFEQIQRPKGVVLLSSLLEHKQVLAIRAPLHIIVSDQEPNLEAITQGAIQAQRAARLPEASYYIAPHTEHTLFDITNGPIDWSDPSWASKFHPGAWVSLREWLDNHK